MELTLNFVQDAGSGNYIATAKVESNWSLHLERENAGFVTLSQRSCASGEFAGNTLIVGRGSCPVYDHDFVHGNVSADCPKWIRLVSEVAVTKGVITADGCENV